MTRIIALDNLRGLAFIFMVIQHIFYFYDVSTNYTTRYSSNPLISLSGSIARNLFILLAGICLTLNNKKQTPIQNRVKRSLEIGLYALIISGITYIYYPDKYVQFGVLHFLAIGTLLLSFITPYPVISILILICLLCFKFPITTNKYLNVMLGTRIYDNMIDYFPINKWLPLMLVGVIYGQHLDLEQLNNLPLMGSDNILTYLGKNSLFLYGFHIILLILIYSLKK